MKIILENPGNESSGTGFFINEFGHIVTNYHVIEGCKKIYQDEQVLEVIAKDQINDLVILKVPIKIKNIYYLKKIYQKKVKVLDRIPIWKILETNLS